MIERVGILAVFLFCDVGYALLGLQRVKRGYFGQPIKFFPESVKVFRENLGRDWSQPLGSNEKIKMTAPALTKFGFCVYGQISRAETAHAAR